MQNPTVYIDGEKKIKTENRIAKVYKNLYNI
jgi:hypothetical protein